MIVTRYYLLSREDLWGHFNFKSCPSAAVLCVCPSLIKLIQILSSWSTIKPKIPSAGGIHKNGDAHTRSYFLCVCLHVDVGRVRVRGRVGWGCYFFLMKANVIWRHGVWSSWNKGFSALLWHSAAFQAAMGLRFVIAGRESWHLRTN